MCGRYTLTIDPETLAQLFGLGEITPAAAGMAPRYNIAPTQQVAIVRNDAPTKLDVARWGLVPSWAKDLAIGASMINARAETMAEKPAFRSAFRKRRCLILADGFYEWETIAGQKTKLPHYIQLADGQPFAFAGLWETWKPKDAPDSDWMVTCTIATTDPNELLGRIHNRQAVILPRGSERVWLDADAPADVIGSLLRPLPSDALRMRPVAARVGNVRNDDAALLAVVS
jgi:putative SOS response-associated peptidase YedK